MINQSSNLSSKLAVDVKEVGNLRQAARQNSPEALKETAQQFEAMFMNMVMKSMRDATPSDSPFESEQTKMYTSMLDQQFTQNMAKRGVGLADVLMRQLSNSTGIKPDAVVEGAADGAAAGVDGAAAPRNKPLSGMPTTGQLNALQSMFSQPAPAASPMTPRQPAATVAPTSTRPVANRAAHVQAFQDRLGAEADEASRTTGIPAKFMLGQAALETGWGKRQIVAADGTPSHNLFGIKATGNWKGKVVEARTTEFVNGVMQQKTEKFRAYDSYADSFRDYAKLLTTNPRYQNVIANAQDASSFAHGLQKAGYATDPHYAAKLSRIIKQSLSA
ncbi:MAG: flagellar assembly peptidoglycan hydrolase FlgJ [Herminiimonas sp.]|nr:flagellar assembly peptidoglycan hydrolase FlgJ [Herminiimonas sp.]